MSPSPAAAVFITASMEDVRVTEDWRANRLLEVIFHGLPESRDSHRIVHTGAFLPDVFCPGTANRWIVSQAVQEALAPFLDPGAFQPAAFAKLFDHPLPEPDGYDGYDDPYGLVDAMPDVPRFHEEIGAFWRLALPRADDLVPAFDALPMADKARIYYDSASYRRFLAENLDATLLADHPAIEAYGNLLVRGDVYEALLPFLNPRFFSIHEAGPVRR
ncbi:MAG: hypothetical protein RLY93_13510 [Sumerlaeia bacterium]